MSFQWRSIESFNENFDLIRFVEDNYGGRFNGKYVMIPCPFHPETTASCAVYEHSYHCYGAGCGVSGSAYNFIQKTTNLTVKEILRNNEFAISISGSNIKTKQKTIKYPKLRDIKKYNEELLKNPDKLSYLFKRHFNRQAIERSLIGYVKKPYFFTKFSQPRISIPVFDGKKKLISARYRIDPQIDDGEEPKYLAHPFAPTALYNSHILSEYKDIVIVGSELDAAFLYFRYGILAVAPPGEGNFQKEWAYDFLDHNVLIWLDYDNAGVKAAIKAYNILRLVANPKIYIWDGTYRNKDDICDFVTRKSILGVVEVLDNYNVKAYI